MILYYIAVATAAIFAALAAVPQSAVPGAEAQAEAPPEPAEPPVFIELPPEPPRVYAGEVHDVARVCVNEAGFREGVNDCAAIYAVYRWRANFYNTTVSRIARQYSTSVFNPDRPKRQWVPNLNLRMTQPKGWRPQDGNWSTGRELWQKKLDEVWEYSRSELDPCERPVFHWGTMRHPVDRARIENGIRRGYWHPVDCGPTLNTFLAPGRKPAEPPISE